MPDTFRTHVRPEAPTGALVDLDDYELEIVSMALRYYIALGKVDRDAHSQTCGTGSACPDCHGSREMEVRAGDLLRRLPR